MLRRSNNRVRRIIEFGLGKRRVNELLGLSEQDVATSTHHGDVGGQSPCQSEFVQLVKSALNAIGVYVWFPFGDRGDHVVGDDGVIVLCGNASNGQRKSIEVI